jgi:hypothetical protein
VIVALRHAWVRRPSLWQRASARGIIEDDTPAEPAPAAPFVQRLTMHAAVIAGFGALTCAALFEQAAHMRSVADLGDPLFSMWRLDWVAHQLRTNPFDLFHANIFHPEPRTLAYSDAMLATALVAAPWLWLGADVAIVHNVLLLAAIALSGVTMFWLVRDLTASRGAAAVAGAIFALYPLRWAFYANLELEMTLWMPLALLWLRRAMSSGRLRDGLMTGGVLALQTLSSFYFGLFLSLHMAVVFVVLALIRRRRVRPAWRALAAGALLTAVIVAPATVPYFQNRATVGERRLADTARFSARGRDYVRAHPTSRVYGDALPGDGGKLPLFPGVAPIVLAVAGLAVPLPAGVVAYATALAVAADASLGTHGSTYPVLYTRVLPFRGLRAPDRFAVLVGFSLAVLAGYGVARILTRMQRREWRLLTTAGLVVLVTVEAAPSLRLTPVWEAVPPIYASLPAGPETVIVDLPFPQRDGSTDGEYSFLYFATFHHKRMVNGGSGFYPPWYDPLAELMRTFPNDRAMTALRAHGAEYLVLHGAFHAPSDYARVAAALGARDDVSLVATATWNGAESRLYRVR